MEIKFSAPFALKPLVRLPCTMLFLHFIVYLVQRKKLHVWLVHFVEKTRDILCPDIRIPVNGGICDILAVLVHEMVDELREVQLPLGQPVQIPHLIAVLL